MNKKLLFVFALAIVCTGITQAQNAGSPSIQLVSSASQTWTVVANESGIKALSTEVTTNGHRYLYLKFENTTAKSISFAWEMKDKSGKTAASNNLLTVPAGSSLCGFDDATMNGGNMNILLEETQSLSDFTITINKK
jgi:hypothetical protein